MIRLRPVFSILIGTLALAGSGCDALPGRAEVRYRVIVEVVGAAGTATGSGVWRWELSKPDLALATPYAGEFAGEAVAVDLPDGRTLFAILRGAQGGEGAASLLPERWFGDIGRAARGEEARFSPDRLADLRNIASRTGETVELECSARPDWCPMLVTFDNIDDPTSVKHVDPADPGAALGPGYRLQAFRVEITSDEVEHDIRDRLPWLSRHPEPRLDPDYTGSTDPGLPQILSHGDFCRGEC